MRDLSELNVNDGGKPVDRGPPSKEAIEAYEREFGVSLPLDYVWFLSQVNGGHPEKDSFVPTGSSPDNRWGVDNFYHLTGSGESTASLQRVTRNWREQLGADCIPIGSDGGGNQIFLDMAREAAVFLCIHDENFKIVKVASSFSEFLDLLEDDPDML